MNGFISKWIRTTALVMLISNHATAEAPKVEIAGSKPLPTAKLLCTPEVRTLLGYTRRVLHLPDGQTLAVFSYSGSTQANWLFLIDSRDLSAKRYPIPNNDIASHSAALGADGNIYVMPYGTGRAYRFDTKNAAFTPLSVEAPAGEYTWEAIGGSNGCIYFGTYPNACFAEYDTKSGMTTLYKQVAPDAKYVTDFSEEKDGRIRFRAWGPNDNWMLFDPKTRRLEKAETPAKEEIKLPEPPKGDRSYQKQVTADGRRFAVSFPSSKLWEIKDKPVLLGDPKGPAESWFLESVPGAVVGISHFGVVFRYDLKSGSFKSSQLPNSAPGGNYLMFIEALSPGCVIGANYSQQNLFCLDPRTGKIDYAQAMIADVPGEPMCAVGLDGKGYLGIYISSVISTYDPKKPFKFGENPKKLIELGEKYQQTRPRDAATDGKLVFVSSDSSYSHLGGALVVIDPKTGKTDVYHHLIKDQNLPTLAYDPATRLLWGGTDRWGQMRSHPPTQESSLVYAFDPKTRKVAATLTPWPGSDETSVLGVSADGVLVAASGEQIALIDTKTREILYKGVSPIGVPSKIKRGSDGFSYCLAGGLMYRWDLKANTLMPVASTPGCGYLTEGSPGEWTLAGAVSVYRVKLE